MTLPDVEQRLRTATAAANYPADPPPTLIREVQRRRARRAAVARIVTAAAAAAAVVVLLVLLPSSSSTAKHSGPAVKPSPSHGSPSPATAHRQFAPLAARTVPADHGDPSTFFASVTAGAERLAVVDTQSGRIKRYLQQHGSQALLTFNPERTLAWQWTDRGCGNVWSQIDLATGRETPAFTDLPHPNAIAVSAGSRRIAYVYAGAQTLVPVTTPTGTKMVLGGCPSAKQTLVVTDTTSGLTRQWPLPNNGGGAWYPTFNATATEVAFVFGRRVRVLDINRDATFQQAQPVTNADSRCQQSKPQFQPGTDNLFVEEMCGEKAAIVGFHVGDGTVTYRHDIPGRGLIAAYSLDRTGKHLIYSFDPSDGSGNGVVYVAGASGNPDRQVMSDVFDLSW